MGALNFRSLFQSVHTPTLDWAGWTVPGIPFGGVGTNNNVAIAITQNATFPFHLFYNDTLTGAQNYPDITWGSSVYSYNGSMQTIQLSYYDPVTTGQQVVQVSLRWLDAARTIPIYASASQVGGPSTDRRDFWAVAPSFFQSSARPQSQFEHWFRLAQATSITDVATQMANQTQTYGNLIATDRLGGMGFWHQGTTPQRPPTSAAQFAPVVWLEEADAFNEVNPQTIHPLADRANAVHMSGQTPIDPAWICNNAPPHEVVPGILTPAAMTTMASTTPWILREDPASYQNGNSAYPEYTHWPLQPPTYRNIRTQALTDTTAAVNDLNTVEVVMTDTYDSRGMATRLHWIHIIGQLIPSTGPNSLVWPGFEDRGALNSMRNALIAWGSGPDSGMSLPQGSSSQGAAVMALLEAAAEEVRRNDEYDGWCHAFGVDPLWLIERSPERIPDITLWQATSNNLPLVTFLNVPAPGSSVLTPGLTTGNYVAERTVMAWAVAIVDLWLSGQSQGGEGTNLLNEEYWELRIGLSPPTPSPLNAPWMGSPMLPASAAGTPVLLEDPFGWRRPLFMPDQLPEIGILKVMDWGARDSLSTQSGFNYLVDTYSAQYILPMGGANTSVFLQRMVSRSSSHFPTLHLSGSTADPRDKRYDQSAGGLGVSLSTGYHYDTRLVGDSHALFLAQLDPTGLPATVRILPAIGATEVYSIDVRYATSKSFSDRTMIPFPNDPSGWNVLTPPTGWTAYSIP